MKAAITLVNTRSHEKIRIWRSNHLFREYTKTRRRVLALRRVHRKMPLGIVLLSTKLDGRGK